MQNSAHTDYVTNDWQMIAAPSSWNLIDKRQINYYDLTAVLTTGQSSLAKAASNI